MTTKASRWRVFTGRRGRVHTPVVVEAVASGVIELIDPQALVSTCRLPRRLDSVEHPVLPPDDVDGLLELRRKAEDQHRQAWLAEAPYAAALSVA